MRNSHTVVLERLKFFSLDFETEPYEAAWASEAIFFVRLHELSGSSASLQAFVQLSADGVTWVDEGSALPVLTTAGDHFLRVSHFGGWLRLRCVVAGVDPQLKLTIHLVLKS
jgi:hypothetical protein